MYTRGRARVCVSRKSARRAVAAPLIPAFVLGSFEVQLRLFDLVYTALGCRVKLTYLFSAEVTPPTKIM